MFTDTVQIEDSLKTVINSYWEEEMKHFQETFEVEIQSQDNLIDWIRWCQKHSNREGEVSMIQPTGHIFYHLMVLKASFGEETI